MNISFIGLGIMGSRMASNLLKHENSNLTVFNRSMKPADKLADAGAVKADSAANAAVDSDVVFTMLSDPETVASVAFKDKGFVHTMKKDAVWVNCSTVNPSFARECAKRSAEHGIKFIDAPVAGSLKPAENGELTFLVGGKENDIEFVKPLFELMGKKVLNLGAAGQGSAFKMLVNSILAQSMAVYSETALLGEKLGFSRDFLMDVLPELPVTAPFFKGKSSMIKNGDYETEFPLELMLKDLHLLDITAYEKDHPLYLGSIAKQLYSDAKAQGLGRKDFASIFSFLEHSKK
ncbi:MAG: NAD(P)-dependent oxidoreductase [Thermodesulfobacteriota bacterium]